MIKYAIIAAISFGITFLYMKSQNGRTSNDVMLKTAIASSIGSVFAAVIVGVYESQKSSMITGTMPTPATVPS